MTELSPERAAELLLCAHRMGRFEETHVVDLLNRLRCIQMDPLSPHGNSPDLTVLARIRDYRCGSLYEDLFPGHAFEHFAKERCILPASAFPYYRNRAAETPWWRLTERLKRVPTSALEEVLAEVTERGPLAPSEMADRGKVQPLDWSGWKGTGKLSTMALEILWTRCEVVIAGRSGKEKRYDIPSRALPDVVDHKPGEFGPWAVLERVRSAGILQKAGGPHWSMLEPLRTSGLPEAMVAAGDLAEVTVAGSSRRYLVEPQLLSATLGEMDDHMRILAPLDPFLWDRKLIEQVFGFQYVWEVYKPAKIRRWGWYVCPLLHKGRLVGRLEARVIDGVLVVQNMWREDEQPDKAALDACLDRLTRSLGGTRFKRPRSFKKNPK